MIDGYTENEKLKESLYEFIKFRKASKATITTLALKKILTRLDTLAASDLEKIEILDTSIMNGWKGVFPLKKNKSSPDNASSKKNDGSSFNNFEPRKYDYDSLEKSLLGWD